MEQKEHKAKILGLQNMFYHQVHMSQQGMKILNESKRKDRPFIQNDDWNKQDYYHKNITKSLWNCSENVQRRNCDELSCEQFHQKYHKNKKTVLISGCTTKWKSQSFWNHNFLEKELRNQLFKVGEDDDGQKIRITMKNFIQYLVHNEDDSPLYLFENTNIVNEKLQPILEGYTIPPYFTEDIFTYLEDKDRPPYRWFLMGPERSGSTVHIDPCMTCAWNTSFVGHKRWVLFDQKTPKNIVKGKQFRPKHYVDEAINYFVQILPKIKQKYSQEELGLIQFIQKPGQTVFVPAGMWHAVLNLDDTIAVTQNFLHQMHIEEGWKAIMEEKQYLVPLLLQKIKIKNPSLFEKIKSLDESKDSAQLSISEKFFCKNVKKKSRVDHSFQESDKEFIVQTGEKDVRKRVLSQHKYKEKRKKSRDYSYREKLEDDSLDDI